MRISPLGGALPPKGQDALPRFAWVIEIYGHGLVARGRLEGFASSQAEFERATANVRKKLELSGFTVFDETAENAPSAQPDAKLREDLTAAVYALRGTLGGLDDAQHAERLALMERLTQAAGQ